MPSKQFFRFLVLFKNQKRSALSGFLVVVLLAFLICGFGVLPLIKIASAQDDAQTTQENKSSHKDLLRVELERIFGIKEQSKTIDLNSAEKDQPISEDQKAEEPEKGSPESEATVIVAENSAARQSEDLLKAMDDQAVAWEKLAEEQENFLKSEQKDPQECSQISSKWKDWAVLTGDQIGQFMPIGQVTSEQINIRISTINQMLNNYCNRRINFKERDQIREDDISWQVNDFRGMIQNFKNFKEEQKMYQELLKNQAP